MFCGNFGSSVAQFVHPMFETHSNVVKRKILMRTRIIIRIVSIDRNRGAQMSTLLVDRYHRSHVHLCVVPPYVLNRVK